MVSLGIQVWLQLFIIQQLSICCFSFVNLSRRWQTLKVSCHRWFNLNVEEKKKAHHWYMNVYRWINISECLFKFICTSPFLKTIEVSGRYKILLIMEDFVDQVFSWKRRAWPGHTKQNRKGKKSSTKEKSVVLLRSVKGCVGGCVRKALREKGRILWIQKGSMLVFFLFFSKRNVIVQKYKPTWWNRQTF